MYNAINLLFLRIENYNLFSNNIQWNIIEIFYCISPGKRTQIKV